MQLFPTDSKCLQGFQNKVMIKTNKSHSKPTKQFTSLLQIPSMSPLSTSCHGRQRGLIGILLKVFFLQNS